MILLIPAYESGRGGGHLCRCMTLACDLRAMGREAWLYLPAQAGNMDSLFRSTNFNFEWRITDDDLPHICKKSAECIVLDRFQTPPEELSRWKEIAPAVGIDEGGPCRDSFDFLIDILIPEKFIVPPANITDPSLIKFPSTNSLAKKETPDGTKKILVSFGQEDSAGLGLAVTQALCAGNFVAKSAKNNSGSMDITWLRGGLAKKEETEPLPNVRILETIPNLAEHLGEYDLVITHYGITAYETLYAQTQVLLVSPTPYHEKLAKAAGFTTVSVKNLKKSVSHRIKGVRHHLRKGASLAALLDGFSPQINRHCPVCAGNFVAKYGEKAPARCLCRFPERTYRRCSICGVIFMDRTCPPPVEYEREYFFYFYKKQYGKTYIEDFPKIKTAGKRRLKIIKSLLSAADTRSFGSSSLLDIGCAYGPFLDTAREEGFSPVGIEPAEDAVRYVQETLSLPAIHGLFPNCSAANSSFLIPHSYNVITLWYVIEHFTDCVQVLAEIKKLLKPGGILAFSTPSFSGISGHYSLRRFLETSPSDHRTIWSPVMCRKALALAGFKIKKITISGHHPERFPLLGKFAKSKRSPLYWLLLAISKIFGLGDTFEVYAQVLPLL